jgi:hypothetical protein
MGMTRIIRSEPRAKTRNALLALMIAATTTGAHAADATGNFAVRGAASASCSAFLAAVDGEDQALRAEAVRTLTIWLGGYLTHANRVSENTFDIVPLASDQDVLAVVSESCRQAPDQPVAIVAHAVMELLASLRVTNLSDIVVVAPDLPVRAPTVLAVQQRLIDLGFLQGNPDGVFGRNSLAALEAFKSREGLSGQGPGLTLDAFLRLFSEEFSP